MDAKFDFSREPGRFLKKSPIQDFVEPLISVITAFYNAGDFFEQTFNCVINQTFPWFEWIIVDDGSTDEESQKLLRSLASKDARIRLYFQENKGLAAARNAAVSYSSSELFVPLDSDDLIAPTYLEQMYWTLFFHPEASWAYPDSCGFGDRAYCWLKPFSSKVMKRENILIVTSMIRKAAYDAVGGYEVLEKQYYEDWVFWLKLLSAGKYPVHTGGILYWYRRRKNGLLEMTKNDRNLQVYSMKRIRAAADGVSDDIRGIEYPGPGAEGKYQAPRRSAWNGKTVSSAQKINILMLIPWMEMGGADRFNLDICRMLDKTRFEIGILATQPGGNAWRQRFEEYVEDIFCLYEFLDLPDYGEFISYYIISREVKVLFLSNSYYGYSILPWLRLQFPDLTIIDYVHREEWDWRSGGYGRTSGVMGDMIDRTFVCNDRTRNALISDFARKPETVETLYIGVDHNWYDPETVSEGSAKEALGIAAERPMILFPCRIHPVKRPFLMLAIAAELKKKKPDIVFAVVGDGPLLEELKLAAEIADLKDTVYFVGSRIDMRPWYRDSCLTLICSREEGLALTAYESLSMGVPVISSDVGGQKELIDDTVGRLLPLLQKDNISLEGQYYSEEEAKQYAAAIMELITDKNGYSEMSKNCRDRIEEYFSTEKMIGNLEKSFEELPEASRESRQKTVEMLSGFPGLAAEPAILYGEVAAFEAEYAWANRMEERRTEECRTEECRTEEGISLGVFISKCRRKLIRLADKLRLNRLFR